MSKIIPKCGIGTKLRYKKIQKDMIFVPMPYYGISKGHTTKKRDCNLAVPRIEALVLPFVTNSNTVAHAIYIYNKVRVYTYAYE